MISACRQIPHPSKAHFGGEDAFFITKSAFGVADGVGGWAQIPGGNSAKYAKDLMKLSAENASEPSSLRILEKAFNKMDKTIKGSSTACIAKLIDSTLDILNIGDSGLVIISNGDIVYKTKQTTHGFNFPYQLGMGSGTKPSDGTNQQFKLRGGELVITGTDGLWDNAYTDNILEIARGDHSPEETAELLAVMASKNANDRGFRSPFAREASRYGYFYNGGKLDDITVIATRVN